MRLRCAIAALVAGVTVSTAAASDIASSRHNLSVSGPGPVRAAAETQICIFCHTPHNASSVAQLWNRSASTATYTPYTSSSLDAAPGQPTGSSKLCLSCHDGTIALGDVLSRATPIPMAGGVTQMPAGPSNLGTTLHDDHPVSFPYTAALAAADGELADPASLGGDVRLDAGGELQCTTCHDAHDDSNGDFLVQDNTAGALCRTCHETAYWTSSSHYVSGRIWNGVPPDPWPHTDYANVSDNACESCHNPHTAATPERLLNQAPEETNCLVCHNGNVARTDLDAEFAKVYTHPIDGTVGIHDSEEPGLVVDRHVECSDCHNGHAANPAGGFPPEVSGWQYGVKGVDTAGGAVDPASYQYETCYRCHADSPGLPTPTIPRVVAEANKRLQFDPANPSYHPVETAGANPNVPSLLGNWSESSVMYCIDCHTNDEGPRSGGSGPEGPHGSSYPALLGWRYETADRTQESVSAYNLCYRCHSRASILSDISFGEHRRHIVNEDTPCSACHDPHGVRVGGGGGDHTHLINFDTSIVSPRNGVLEFNDNGLFHGSCTLSCHGESHSNETY
ncbi:MAG: cytochrome c3 family protein [bacterium]